MPPGKGRVTKLSALPPAAVAKDASHTSTNGSINGEAPASTGDSTSGSGRSLADMSRRELAQERRSLLMRLFADTGTAKIPGVIRYVRPRIIYMYSTAGICAVATAASFLCSVEYTKSDHCGKTT